MTKDEALKMAVEALKDACGLTPRDAHFCKAIQACKEALEQPAQEPVAWISVKDKLPDVGVEVLTYDTHHEKKYFLNSIIIDNVDKFYFNGFTHWMPLPSAPNETNTHPAPSFIGLSDDEITKILHHPDGNLTIIGFARAIEQAHGIGVKVDE